MKTKRAVGVAVLVALVASFSYWLGYQHGSSSSRVTLNTSSKLRGQAGLAFREDRNTVSRFTIPSNATPSR